MKSESRVYKIVKLLHIPAKPNISLVYFLECICTSSAREFLTLFRRGGVFYKPILGSNSFAISPFGHLRQLSQKMGGVCVFYYTLSLAYFLSLCLRIKTTLSFCSVVCCEAVPQAAAVTTHVVHPHGVGIIGHFLYLEPMATSGPKASPIFSTV